MIRQVVWVIPWCSSWLFDTPYLAQHNLSLQLLIKSAANPGRPKPCSCKFNFTLLNFGSAVYSLFLAKKTNDLILNLKDLFEKKYKKTASKKKKKNYLTEIQTNACELHYKKAVN